MGTNIAEGDVTCFFVLFWFLEKQPLSIRLSCCPYAMIRCKFDQGRNPTCTKSCEVWIGYWALSVERWRFVPQNKYPVLVWYMTYARPLLDVSKLERKLHEALPIHSGMTLLYIHRWKFWHVSIDFVTQCYETRCRSRVWSRHGGVETVHVNCSLLLGLSMEWHHYERCDRSY